MTRDNPASTMQPMYTFTVTLANGDVHTFDRATKPRFWKSWIIRQCPYGLCFLDATFTREER